MATRKKRIRSDESISAYGAARSTVETAPLSPEELEQILLAGTPVPQPGHAPPQEKLLKGADPDEGLFAIS
jgi:hypothetical protein